MHALMTQQCLAPRNVPCPPPFAAVGKVAGSYYAILVDFDPGAFLATTLHSAVLYAACAVLSGVGTALQRRLALSWRQRLTATLHAAYCAGAAFAGLRLDNPDQRTTRDARALCDDLAAVARVAVSIPFRGAYYAALTAGYLGWRGLAVAAAYFICATLLQWWEGKSGGEGMAVDGSGGRVMV